MVYIKKKKKLLKKQTAKPTKQTNGTMEAVPRTARNPAGAMDPFSWD